MPNGGYGALSVAAAYAALARMKQLAKSDKDVVHTKTIEQDPEPIEKVVSETRQQRRARERREAKALKRLGVKS